MYIEHGLSLYFYTLFIKISCTITIYILQNQNHQTHDLVQTQANITKSQIIIATLLQLQIIIIIIIIIIILKTV